MAATENVNRPEGQTSFDAPSERMEGQLRWFNNAKDVGLIIATTGERVQVAGSGFRSGLRPTGRCSGLPVTFIAEVTGNEAEAIDVAFIDESSPRRARSRRSGYR